MVIDRILKVDSPTNRVQESRDESGRRGGQERDEEEEKKDKDKFDKGRPFWKRLVPDSGDKSDRAITTRLAGTPPPIPLGIPEDTSDTGSTGSLEETSEASVTMSQRLLVLWGVLDIRGRPRPRVIAVYVIIAVVILLSTALIFGILFRGV